MVFEEGMVSFTNHYVAHAAGMYFFGGLAMIILICLINWEWQDFKVYRRNKAKQTVIVPDDLKDYGI